MEASKSLSCENNNISLFSALPESSNMYSNKDSNLISDLEFLDKVKTSHSIELPCIFGWKLCIQSLLGLWEYLKTEQSFQFIFNKPNQPRLC